MSSVVLIIIIKHSLFTIPIFFFFCEQIDIKDVLRFKFTISLDSGASRLKVLRKWKNMSELHCRFCPPISATRVMRSVYTRSGICSILDIQ